MARLFLAMALLCASVSGYSLAPLRQLSNAPAPAALAPRVASIVMGRGDKRTTKGAVPLFPEPPPPQLNDERIPPLT